MAGETASKPEELNLLGKMKDAIANRDSGTLSYELLAILMSLITSLDADDPGVLKTLHSFLQKIAEYIQSETAKIAPTDTTGITYINRLAKDFLEQVKEQVNILEFESNENKKQALTFLTTQIDQYKGIVDLDSTFESTRLLIGLLFKVYEAKATPTFLSNLQKDDPELYKAFSSKLQEAKDLLHCTVPSAQESAQFDNFKMLYEFYTTLFKPEKNCLPAAIEKNLFDWAVKYRQKDILAFLLSNDENKASFDLAGALLTVANHNWEDMSELLLSHIPDNAFTYSLASKLLLSGTNSGYINIVKLLANKNKIDIAQPYFSEALEIAKSKAKSSSSPEEMKYFHDIIKTLTSFASRKTRLASSASATSTVAPLLPPPATTSRKTVTSAKPATTASSVKTPARLPIVLIPDLSKYEAFTAPKTDTDWADGFMTAIKENKLHDVHEHLHSRHTISAECKLYYSLEALEHLATESKVDLLNLLIEKFPILTVPVQHPKMLLAFHIAVELGHIDFVRVLLAKEPSFASSVVNGFSAVYRAQHYNRTDIEALLTITINADTALRQLSSRFENAISTRDTDEIDRLLIDNSIAKDIRIKYATAAIIPFAKSKKRVVIEQVFKAFPDLISHDNTSAAFHIAIQNDDEHLFNFLLASSPALLNKVFGGKSAMDVAVKHHSIKVIRRLLAIPTLVLNTIRDGINIGCVALRAAVKKGQADTVKAFVQRTDISTDNKYGLKSLAFAMENGLNDIAATLVEKTTRFFPRQLKIAERAWSEQLQTTCSQEPLTLDAFRNLLEDTRVSDACKRYFARQVLKAIVTHKDDNADCIEYLFTRFPDLLSEPEAFAAFHLAVEQGHVDTFNYFLTVDSTSYLNSVSLANGLTAIETAAKCGHLTMVETLLKNKSLTLMPVESRRQTPGCRALLLATENKHTDVVKALLTRDDLLVNNRHGAEALLTAAANGSADIITLLLTRPELDINATRGRKTALHLAAENDHAEAVHTLLTAKHHPVQYDLRDEKDHTMFQLAKQNVLNDPRILVALIRKYRVAPDAKPEPTGILHIVFGDVAKSKTLAAIDCLLANYNDTTGNLYLSVTDYASHKEALTSGELRKYASLLISVCEKTNKRVFTSMADVRKHASTLI